MVMPCAGAHPDVNVWAIFTKPPEGGYQSNAGSPGLPDLHALGMIRFYQEAFNKTLTSGYLLPPAPHYSNVYPSFACLMPLDSHGFFYKVRISTLQKGQAFHENRSF
jgi:hypothetical protein